MFFFSLHFREEGPNIVVLKLGITNCTIKNYFSSEYQVNLIEIVAVGASQS